MNHRYIAIDTNLTILLLCPWFHRQLDHDFTRLLAKISDRKSQLKVIEEKTLLMDKNKERKKEKLRHLERKLVAILEAQENELSEIRRKQDEKIETIAKTGVFPTHARASNTSNPERVALIAHEKKQAAKLMDSTETMMKFGFMSMAMTYFTSMNMVGAMKNITSKESQEMDVEELDTNVFNNIKNTNIEEMMGSKSDANLMKWDIDNVIDWLSTIHLGQYTDQFRDASIDGPFLCQLTDADLKDALGIEHVLHRKKILFSINQLNSNAQVRDETHVYTPPDVMKIAQSPTRNTNEVNSFSPNIIDSSIELLSQENEDMKRPVSYDSMMIQVYSIPFLIRIYLYYYSESIFGSIIKMGPRSKRWENKRSFASST